MTPKQLTNFITIGFMILYSMPSIAQDPFKELGAWYILSSNSKISDQWSFQAQTQLRTYEPFAEMQQFKIRVSGTHRFNKNFALALGYGYFRNDFSYLSEVPPSFDEHRIVEDILLNHALGAFNINHRYRLENRFIVQNGETDFRNWFRYEAKIRYPFSEKWVVDLYNEIWLHLEEPIFAQNWLGTGVSYTVSPLIKTRIGYQRIHLEGPDFDRILVQLHFTLDFTNTQSQ